MVSVAVAALSSVAAASGADKLRAAAEAHSSALVEGNSRAAGTTVGSVAAAAGIAEGDVITRVGGRDVGGADELVVAVNSHGNGEDLPVTVVRQGRELVLNARLR